MSANTTLKERPPYHEEMLERMRRFPTPPDAVNVVHVVIGGARSWREADAEYADMSVAHARLLLLAPTHLPPEDYDWRLPPHCRYSFVHVLAPVQPDVLGRLLLALNRDGALFIELRFELGDGL
jgi:hypothetical protein